MQESFWQPPAHTPPAVLHPSMPDHAPIRHDRVDVPQHQPSLNAAYSPLKSHASNRPSLQPAAPNAPASMLKPSSYQLHQHHQNPGARLSQAQQPDLQPRPGNPEQGTPHFSEPERGSREPREYVCRADSPDLVKDQQPAPQALQQSPWPAPQQLVVPAISMQLPTGSATHCANLRTCL